MFAIKPASYGLNPLPIAGRTDDGEFIPVDNDDIVPEIMSEGGDVPAVELIFLF
jgi:hypothetical protein